MPYSTARNRFGRMLDHLGISGAHTHSLRHQFASEALDANPRELANISQVLGHDSIETMVRPGKSGGCYVCEPAFSLPDTSAL
jgi:integrase